MKGPNKIIKQRYDICIFHRLEGSEMVKLKSSFRYWYADPFLYENTDGSFYCFVEFMDNHVKKGQIAVYDSSTKKFSVVISDKFHMSFPFIFEQNNIHYMIPETSAAKELRLYMSVSFPFTWQLSKTLMSGIKAVDSVILKLGAKSVLLLYNIDSRPYRLEAYRFDCQNLEIGEFINGLDDPNKVLRPAGAIFEFHGMLILPTQKGTNSYGEDVIFNQISVGEKIEVKPIDLAIAYPNLVSHYNHKHTYNVTKNYAVLDFSKLVFSPLQLVDGLPCTLKQLRKKP